uniref:Cation-transporting P-type ATPase C-terminal domain-containing protein n=1 Tax=Globodera rostochiensis TaxID=31243 RepID=A0A914HWA6_GLORO
MDRWKHQLRKRWEESGLFHWQKAKNVGGQYVKLLYTEQTMAVEQLADLFPLARIDVHEVLSSRGISHDEARLRLADQCRQRRTRRVRAAFRFLRQFTLSAFPLLLLCSSLICLLIALIDPSSAQSALPMALFQGAILAIICAIGAFGRSRLRRVGNLFQNGGGQVHFVIREGVRVPMRERDILPGDLLWVEAGQRVPVDLRILWANKQFRATANWLTGRPEAMRFTAEPAPRHAPDLFRVRNILFAEFACTRGASLGLVIRTGKNTLFSRLLSMKTFFRPPSLEGPSDEYGRQGQRRESALRQSYRSFVRSIVWLSLGVSTGALLLSLLLTDFARPLYSFVHIFLIVLIVSVPQALPLTLSVQLLLVARWLRQKCGGMLLRQAGVADALGRTSVLMVHSSSVLSSNCPTVTDLWLAGQNKMINAAHLLVPRVNKKHWEKEKAMDQLLQTVDLCCVERDRDRRRPNSEHRRSADVEQQTTGKKSLLNQIVGHLCQTSADHSEEFVMIGHPTDMAFSKFLCQINPAKSSRLLPVREDECPEDILRSIDRPSSVDLMVAKWEVPADTSNDSNAFVASDDRRLAYRLMLRGPAEEVVKMCTMVGGRGGGDGRDSELIDEHHLAHFEDAFLALSSQAKSCVGFAVLDLFDDEVDVLPVFSRGSFSGRSFSVGSDSNGWSFLGMLALANPPGAKCGTQLSELASGGVRLVLLTDQHPIVAEAMAEQLGFVAKSVKVDETAKISVIQMPLELRFDGSGALFGPKGLRKNNSFSSSSGYHSSERGDNENVTKGDKRDIVADLSDDLGKTLFAKMMASGGLRHSVFSQLNLRQVLALIKELQLHGHSVAFVGDDPLKDAPALRLADVGIAQNDGSSLLKEASDVLCANVQLGNLLKAIGEGRLLVANLASTLAFSLSFTVPALLPVLLSLLMPLPSGMTPLQTLSVTLLIQIPPAIAMVFQRQTGPLRTQKIRKPLAPCGLLLYVHLLRILAINEFWSETPINSTTIHFPAGVSSLAQQNQLIGQARAAWLLTLGVSQLVHAWICAGFLRRNWRDGTIFRNWPLWVAVLLDLSLLSLLIYVPGLNFSFGAEPPPQWIWLFPVGTALGLLALNASLKIAIRIIRQRVSKTCATRIASLVEW